MVGAVWIGLLNGPNLSRLGSREPEVYGRTTYAELVEQLERRAAELGVELDVFQSNHEGALIDRVHAWTDDARLRGAIVNPGGLAHTSVALRDALAAFGRPIVEVHLTNIAAREPFRRRSLVSGVARGVVAGLGPEGYRAALDCVAALVREDSPTSAPGR